MTIFPAKTYIKRQFETSALNYDTAAFLQREVCNRLLSQFEQLKIKPTYILDLGCGTGYLSRALSVLYPKAKIVGLDLAFNMAKHGKNQNGWFSKISYLNGVSESLPFQDQRFDLIISANMLQWCSELETVFGECHRVLKPNGLFLFTSFGPDTLKELRNAWSKVDNHPHTHAFLDMHHYGDLLLHKQFDEPVMDMEMLTVEYEHPKHLLLDLKTIGASNIHPQRQKTLTGKSKLKQMLAQYALHKNEQGTYPATYEIIYGHAIKPKRQVHYQAGTLHIPIESTLLNPNK